MLLMLSFQLEKLVDCNLLRYRLSPDARRQFTACSKRAKVQLGHQSFTGIESQSVYTKATKDNVARIRDAVLRAQVPVVRKEASY